MRQKIRRVIGIHACKETLQTHPKSIQLAYISKNWQTSDALKDFHDLLTQYKISIRYKSQNFLRGWQGIALESNHWPTWNWNKVKNSQKMTLVAIDNLEDPQNLGNILRSSWLFGAYGVLLCKHYSAHLTESVHKIASGAVEHVPIETVTNLSDQLKKLKDIGFWVYGLETYKEKNAKLLYQEKFPQKIVLLVGSEGKGIRKQVKKICDQILTIPQAQKAHSLNASTSLAITLYETHKSYSNTLK